MGAIPTLARILALVACLVMMFGVLVSEAVELLPPDIKRIKDRGKIIVAQCSIVQPGFYWFDDGGAADSEPFFPYKGRRLIGTDIAMAMQIAEELGVELELDRSSKDFNAVCRRVANGQADIGISKLSITLERAQYVRFTRPYAVLGAGLLVNRLQQAKTRSKASLWDRCNRPGTRIGVWRGTASETYARELFPRAEIQPYETFDGLLDAVAGDELFAALDEDFGLRLKLHEESRWALWLRFVPIPEKRDPIGIAVAPDSPNLLAFLNLFLEYKAVKVDLEELLRKTGRAKRAKRDRLGKGAGK
jgi:ABC-type amino acid transport substrate-binding protein